MDSRSHILKEGFLVKKGHLRKNWRTRWFVLLKQDLLYFRNKEERVPAGVIPLNGANLVCPLLETSKKPWLLNLITHDNKNYMIQASGQPAREEWKAAIEDCIRKLDPAKVDKKMSPTRTLARTEGFASNYETYRDIVQAMQDRHAGVKLKEFKVKGKTGTKYFFTGADTIDWLISWSFANSRTQASALASEILQYGFFNPVHLDTRENVYEKLKDSVLSREMADSPEAFYDFVVFAPEESMDLFALEEGEDEEDEESDSDSEEEAPASVKLQRGCSSSIMEESKIYKQGFLLKKCKRRHTWKARKFVLKECEGNLLYYKGSKGNRVLGGIPLKDITVVEKDVDPIEVTPSSSSSSSSPVPHVTSCFVSNTKSLPHPAQRSKSKTSVGGQMRSRLVLLTATGYRYELEAIDSCERDSWVAQIRMASKLC